MPLSPHVEKLLNSKVIKSFVPELRSRKCFSCVEIPMFYVYEYEHSMYISHIHVYGYGIRWHLMDSFYYIGMLFLRCLFFCCFFVFCFVLFFLNF